MRKKATLSYFLTEKYKTTVDSQAQASSKQFMIKNKIIPDKEHDYLTHKQTCCNCLFSMIFLIEGKEAIALWLLMFTM